MKKISTKDTSEKLKALRKKTGLSQEKFSRRYNIPLRTYQNWEENRTKPPEYLYGFLKNAVERDLKRSDENNN